VHIISLHSLYSIMIKPQFLGNVRAYTHTSLFSLYLSSSFSLSYTQSNSNALFKLSHTHTHTHTISHTYTQRYIFAHLGEAKLTKCPLSQLSSQFRNLFF